MEESNSNVKVKVSMVKNAVERLEQLVKKSEDLNFILRDVFSSVISETLLPPEEEVKDYSSCSELARSIMIIVDKLESEFASIRRFADSSDL